MPRRAPADSSAVALRVDHVDRPEAIATIAARVAVAGGRIRTLSTVRRLPAFGAAPAVAEVEIEVEGLSETDLVALLEDVEDVRQVHLTRALERIFGKRIIVIGGGAQVAQVALGAVSEADRHNLRGERISVDTIALVGESEIAAAVRAVGIPIISLNMVGSITEHVDLVVSDPVQAGTMAVMAIAETATFDLARQRGRRY